jgi:hypothetical protein
LRWRVGALPERYVRRRVSSSFKQVEDNDIQRFLYLRAALLWASQS